MHTYDVKFGNDWKTVDISVSVITYFELHAWLLANIDDTPVALLPDRFKYEFICAGANWWISLMNLYNTHDQTWRVGFKNLDDLALFKLTWL